MRLLSVLLICCLLLLLPTHGLAQDTLSVHVLVVDRESGLPVSLASVRGMGVTRDTDREGVVLLPLVRGMQRIAVSRIGFAPADTVVPVEGPVAIRIVLAPRPLDIGPLTVRAQRSEGGPARERALFHREPVPGLVGISRTELRELPLLGEADVLRALQSLPGVASANDLSARLHVNGGAPDQNVYLLDGARVFAPYHMFGIFGSFNADAVGRAEVYRGSLPARYGGALSSVVDVEQRAGSEEGVEGAGGLGMLGMRLLLAGPTPVFDGSWMVAARRTHADLVLDRHSERGFPYAFWDAHGQVTLRPHPDHRVRLSVFGSEDRFRMFLETVIDNMLSRWSSGVASVQWDWTPGAGLGSRTVVWGSRYDSSLGFGSFLDRPTSRDEVAVGGAKTVFSRQGQQGGFQAGLEVEDGRVDLIGGQQAGGLFMGSATTREQTAAAFIDVERWVGPLRLSPGLRVEWFNGQAVRFAPRLFGRLHLSGDIALTAGLTRSHQVLSTLRDDRFSLPGPPFWFAQGREMPVSRSDAATLALEGWLGRAWSFDVSLFGRALHDIARWRPEEVRTLAGLSFDDGHATGLSVSLRRHTGRITGWIAYDLSRVKFKERESGQDYSPPWEHRQTFRTALSVRVRRDANISAQAAYSTGAPFWPPNGEVPMWQFDPIRGVFGGTDPRPTWSTGQMRLPDYFRLDIAVRWPFRLGAMNLEPYLSLLNVTGRQNVLYYTLVSDMWQSPRNYRAQLRPNLQLPIPMAFPSVGVDIRF
ncbi:MAG: TonB-dependent receptor plug domain-containing protein [Gemmatimonadota bacterium]